MLFLLAAFTLFLSLLVNLQFVCCSYNNTNLSWSHINESKFLTRKGFCAVNGLLTDSQKMKSRRILRNSVTKFCAPVTVFDSIPLEWKTLCKGHCQIVCPSPIKCKILFSSLAPDTYIGKTKKLPISIF